MVDNNDREGEPSDQSSDDSIYIDAAIRPTTTDVEKKRENATVDGGVRKSVYTTVHPR